MQVDKKGNLIPFGAAAKGVFMDVSKRGVWAAAAAVLALTRVILVRRSV